MSNGTVTVECRRPRGHFGLVVYSATLIAFYTASSAPTPLYPLYQARWSLSAGMLSAIFGVYPLSLLLALLVGGKLSDHIGRRPVIAGAIVVILLTMAMLFLANGAASLVAARIVQGLATGIGTVALGAAVIDLDVERGALITAVAPSVGMALGAFGTAALIQLAPAPLHIVYVLLSAVFVIQFIFTLAAPETTEPRAGVLKSLIPSIAIPSTAKAELISVAPLIVSAWAFGGFFMSLMPSLIVKVTGSSSAWLGGISVAIMTLSSMMGSLCMRKTTPVRSLLNGATMLALGMGLILVGANSISGVVFLIGCVVAGLGVGAGFLGAMRCVFPLAEPSRRAGLMAAFFVVCYLANSFPAMIAGYLAGYVDLMLVADAYGVVVILLVLLSFSVTLRRLRAAQTLPGHA